MMIQGWMKMNISIFPSHLHVYLFFSSQVRSTLEEDIYLKCPAFSIEIPLSNLKLLYISFPFHLSR